MKIGELIDQYKLLKDKKDTVAKEVKEVTDKLTELKQEILALMEFEGLNSASGELATATKSIRTFASSDDMEKTINWIAKNKRYDMLMKRLNAPPILEMLDIENKLPPGVKTWNEATINIRKK